MSQINYTFMHPVKFKITELGAVRDSELELSPLMVFSGESGLGKSYVAFLIHYLYVLLTGNRLNNFCKQYDLKVLLAEKKNKDMILRIKISELLTWINKDAISYIGYLLGHDFFDGQVEIDIPLTMPLEFRSKIVPAGLSNEKTFQIQLHRFTCPAELPKQFDILNISPLALLIKAVLIDAIFGSYPFLKQVFIMPPSRGSLIELNSRPAFSSGMYEEFFENKETLEGPQKEVQNISREILQYLSDINVGDIRREDSKYIYKTNNGKDIPLTAAASSIKELASLTLFFKKYPSSDSKQPLSGSSILFEEPEAHLHPARQMKVADLIGCAVGLGSHMQITTHSDYFMGRLNRLIQMYRLKDKNPLKYGELSAQYGFREECLLNPEQVKAYVFTRNKDGYTTIEKQDIGVEGIPYTSFHKVIEEDIKLSVDLKQALEEE
ncbi:MAG: AAA family ATPase [Bacteroidales bacterium]